MDAVLSATFIYAFLLLLMRISGPRTLSQMTTFDFVLLLIVGEATQQALLGQDFSLTNAALVITTLLGLDLLLSIMKNRSPSFAQWVDGIPMIIVENGKVLRDRIDKARVMRAKSWNLRANYRVSSGSIKYASLSWKPTARSPWLQNDSG